MNLFQKWAERKYSLPIRILGTLPAGAIFAYLIPYSLIVLLPPLDRSWGLPSFFIGMVNYIVGGMVVLIGIIFAWWTILLQFMYAGGTPLPVMATQKLLANGPFKLCRNPMGFGAVTAYLGISLLIGSIVDLLFTALFLLFFVCYIKGIEEKELTARFGQAYLDYKAGTPFLIPGFFYRK